MAWVNYNWTEYTEDETTKYYWPCTEQKLLQFGTGFYYELIRKLCFLWRNKFVGDIADSVSTPEYIWETDNVYDVDSEGVETNTDWNDWEDGFDGVTVRAGIVKIACDGITYANKPWDFTSGTASIAPPPIGGIFAGSENASWYKISDRNKYRHFDTFNNRIVYHDEDNYSNSWQAYRDLSKQADPNRSDQPTCPIDFVYDEDDESYPEGLYEFGNTVWYSPGTDDKILPELNDWVRVIYANGASANCLEYYGVAIDSSHLHCVFSNDYLSKNTGLAYPIQLCFHHVPVDESGVCDPGSGTTAFASQRANRNGDPMGTFGTLSAKEPKLASSIDALVEFVLDGIGCNLYFPVTSIYTDNYDAVWSQSYADKFAAGDADGYEPACDAYWGCNSSPLEYIMKLTTGTNSWTPDWIFDTATPFKPYYYSSGAWTLWSGVPAVAGTWRRHRQFAFEQSGVNCPATIRPNTNAPTLPDSYGMWKAAGADSSANFTTSNPTGFGTNSTPEQSNGIKRHEPHSDYYHNEYQVSFFEVDKLVSFYNELWLLLTTHNGQFRAGLCSQVTAGTETEMRAYGVNFEDATADVPDLYDCASECYADWLDTIKADVDSGFGGGSGGHSDGATSISDNPFQDTGTIYYRAHGDTVWLLLKANAVQFSAYNIVRSKLRFEFDIPHTQLDGSYKINFQAHGGTPLAPSSGYEEHDHTLKTKSGRTTITIDKYLGYDSETETIEWVDMSTVIYAADCEYTDTTSGGLPVRRYVCHLYEYLRPIIQWDEEEVGTPASGTTYQYDINGYDYKFEWERYTIKTLFAQGFSVRANGSYTYYRPNLDDIPSSVWANVFDNTEPVIDL